MSKINVGPAPATAGSLRAPELTPMPPAERAGRRHCGSPRDVAPRVASSTCPRPLRPRVVSRRAVVLAVVAIVLVQLGLVVGLAYADVQLRRWAEATAEHEVMLRLPQAEHVEVRIDGFSLTLGLLTGPRIEGVHVRVDAVEHSGIRATALRLDIEGIRLDRRALLHDRRLAVQSIEWAHVEGALSPGELSAIIGHPVEIHGHALFASVDAHPVRLHPRARGRWLELHVEGTENEPLLYPLPAGATTCKPVATVTAGRLRLSCAVDHLPESIRRALAMSIEGLGRPLRGRHGAVAQTPRFGSGGNPAPSS